MKTSFDWIPAFAGMTSIPTRQHLSPRLQRRRPNESRGPVAFGILIVTCFLGIRTSEAASTGTFQATTLSQFTCDAACQINLIQNDLDKNDVQAAFKQFEMFHATFPGNLEINPICDQFYQLQSSANVLTQDQFNFLNRSACGTHESMDNLLFLRGKALFMQHDCANAQKYFQRIIQIYPNNKHKSEATAYNAQCESQKTTEHSK